MRRLSRETVRTRIWVALTVLKPWQKRAVGVDLEGTRARVTDDLVYRIMGAPEGKAVLLVPHLAGPTFSKGPGRWGEDEPHPFPDLPFSDR